MTSGGWERSNWGPMWMTGPGLANSTVGIFGLGRIGMGVMTRLKGFNVAKFLYHDIAARNDGNFFFKIESPHNWSFRIGLINFHPQFLVDATFVDFDTLLKESDFIVTMCSLTPETKEIFNERAFSLMKPTAVFVNTSRGGKNCLISTSFLCLTRHQFFFTIHTSRYFHFRKTLDSFAELPNFYIQGAIVYSTPLTLSVLQVL